MRTRQLHYDHCDSSEAMSHVAPFAERLPFRPTASWYDAYWCEDRSKRSTAEPVRVSPLNSLLRGFVRAWFEAVGGWAGARVSQKRGEQVDSTRRPTLAGGR